MGDIIRFKRPRRPNAKRKQRSLRAGALAWAALLAIALFTAAISERSAVAANTIASSQRAGHTSLNARDLRVIDGDTLELRATGERIRIANIDTPEISEPACAAERRHGLQAKSQAQALLARAETIEIRLTGGADRYGRTLARLRIDNADLGGALIAGGLARPWRGHREPWCDARGNLLV